MDPKLSKISPTPEESRWKIKTREIAIENEWVRYVHDTGVTDKGKKYDYHFLDAPLSVAVIALTDQAEMILIKQYRYTIAKDEIEIPAGGVKKGDDLKVTAEKELMEETGYKAKHLEKIGEFAADLLSNQVTHVYLATGCEKKAKQQLEDTELGIKVELHFIEDVFEMVQKGKIFHGYTLSALMLAWPHLL